MIYPKPRRVNVERMKRHRVRFGIMYQTQKFSRDTLLDMGEAGWGAVLADLVDSFRERSLAHHMYDKYRWGSGLKLDVSREYDLDYNLEIFRIEERKMW